MTKKHGLRILGNHIIMHEHKAYFIIDAPTADSFQKLMAEPSIVQWLSHNITEVKFALTKEDEIKFMPK
jgi:hypothetical protein